MTGTTSSCAPFGLLGHKMMNDTKGGQLQNARNSGFSGTRTGGKQVRSIVAEARRLRAAKLAEPETLPVRVVKLTDADAVEAQCGKQLI